MVWFSLSFRPLENGVFTAVNIKGICFSSKNFLNSFEFIPEYWSAKIIPILLVSVALFINFMKSPAFCVFDVKMNAYLVK